MKIRGLGHGWLAVEVVGVASNRSGIGTQLRVDVVEGGQRQSLYRWVGSGGSFGGNPLRQYVWLGSAERVAQLVVFWPQSGREQVFAEVPVKRDRPSDRGTGTTGDFSVARF